MMVFQVALLPAVAALAMIADGHPDLDLLRDIPGHTPPRE